MERIHSQISILVAVMLLVSAVTPTILFSSVKATNTTTTSYNPSHFNLLGNTTHISGSVSNLTVNDGINMTFTSYNATPTQYVAEVVFNGTSNTFSWLQLNLTMDGSWSIGSVNVTIQLYNYTLGDYPLSGNGYMNYNSSSTADTDETVTQSISINSTDFRDSSGNWKLRIRGTATTATQFDFRLDWVELKVTYNRPPTLEPIGNKTVTADELLQFTVNASDPDGDTLNYSASNLPQGALFNSTTHAFAWTPNGTQIGVCYVNFEVSDGALTDSENITITVNTITATAIGALGDMDEYIQDLPDEAFKNNPESRKAALHNKLQAVERQIENGAFKGAEQKLLNDILSKMDGSLGGKANNDWITDPDAQEYLFALINLILNNLSDNHSVNNNSHGSYNNSWSENGAGTENGHQKDNGNNKGGKNK